MKRKDLCKCCGVSPQQVHSFCNDCHSVELDDNLESYASKVGNCHLTRSAEHDCWVCQNLKSNYRQPRFSKKELLNMAEGRCGKSNREKGIIELKSLRDREERYTRGKRTKLSDNMYD